MAFFSSQKDHRIKRSYSTERIKPRPPASISSSPSSAVSAPPIRTRSSSRPATVYDPHTSDLRTRGRDPEPPTPKLNTSRYSLRRVPVPSLSTQDLSVPTYDRPRTSPTIPSSRSTSVSRKSSIIDVGGVSNATAAKTNPDHLKSPTNTETSTPSRSSPNNWESSSGSRDTGATGDSNKTLPPIIDSLIRLTSPKQVTPPMHSPTSASQKPQRAVLRRKSIARAPTKQPSVPNFSNLVSPPLSLDTSHNLKQPTSEREPRSPGILLSRMLTPAGAVAAAYKEQEKRRKSSRDFTGPNTNGKSHWDSQDEDGGAYYTVFGSSGKVVAVGAPQDERLSRYDLSTYPPNKTKSVSRKPSLGALGRLSLKPSIKTKKSGTGNALGFTSESEHGHDRIPRDVEAGRLSLQGRRSSSLPSKHRSRKSLGISVGNPDVGLISDPPESATTPSKSGGWSLDGHSPSTGGKIWKIVKRISTGGLREKYTAQEAAPPVPALPEGLLPTPPLKPKLHARSAPHSPDNSNPPISRYVRGRSSFGDAPFSSRHRGTQGAPSLVSSHRTPTLSSGKTPSHRQPSTNTQSSSPASSDKASSKYWQKSRSSSVSTFEEMPPLPRRSATSRPILSPTELHKLEKEQAMADLPSPPSTVDSHSPNSSNQHGSTAITRKPSSRGVRMRANGEDSETDGMSTSDFTALPTPPRHHYKSSPHIAHQQSNDGGPIFGSVSTSPTIPMFSTEDAVNQFRPVKGGDGGTPDSSNPSSASQSAGTTLNGFGVAITIQPPPRPQRSSKRKPLVPTQQAVTRVSQDRGRDGRDDRQDRGAPLPTPAPQPNERMLGTSPELGDHDAGGTGRSYGTFGSSQSMGLVELVKTSQDSSSQESFKPSPSFHSRSPLTFREMGSGEDDKKVLTEKEKVDKWDDLLEKSDRAGGTIHIGKTKLLSDSLRFSDYSTLTLSAV